MTLEEAIKHYEKLAEAGERDAQRWVTDGWQSSFKSLTPEREAQYLSERKRLYNQCLKCAKEHRQLAEWLRELKAYREILANAEKTIASTYGCVIIEGYADVIEQMKEVFEEVNADADSD